MSDRWDGREVRRWWATPTVRPQYRVLITAIPTPDGWTVRLHRLDGICDDYETVCATGWEAAEEAREIMAAVDVMDDWTMSVG